MNYQMDINNKMKIMGTKISIST